MSISCDVFEALHAVILVASAELVLVLLLKRCCSTDITLVFISCLSQFKDILRNVTLFDGPAVKDIPNTVNHKNDDSSPHPSPGSSSSGCRAAVLDRKKDVDCTDSDKESVASSPRLALRGVVSKRTGGMARLAALLNQLEPRLEVLQVCSIHMPEKIT